MQHIKRLPIGSCLNLLQIGRSDANGTLNKSRPSLIEDDSQIEEKCAQWPADVQKNLRCITSALDVIKERLRSAKCDEARAIEWILAASVLDRTFLVIFLLLVAIVHLVIFNVPP